MCDVLIRAVTFRGNLWSNLRGCHSENPGRAEWNILSSEQHYHDIWNINVTLRQLDVLLTDSNAGNIFPRLQNSQQLLRVSVPPRLDLLISLWAFSVTWTTARSLLKTKPSAVIKLKTQNVPFVFCLHWSFSSFCPYRHAEPHTSLTNIQAPPTGTPNHEKAVQLHAGSPLSQMSDFYKFTHWTGRDSCEGRDEVTYWGGEEVGKRYRSNHTSSSSGERERRKPGSQMEFLFLWDDLSENISFRASPALYTFSIDTQECWADCEPLHYLLHYLLPTEEDG